MTSATVTQLNEMFTGISSGVGNTVNQNGEFAEIFQTASEKKEDVSVTDSVKTTTVENNINVSRTAEKLREHQPEEVQAKSKDMDVVKEELNETVEELKKEIAEKLDITVEELETVMENLGLTDASLFSQEGMTALVMEVEQISTPVELLTNAEVYQTLQELNAKATELLGQVQTDNQLTDQQVEEVLMEFAKTKEDSEVIARTEAESLDVTVETENVDTDTEQNKNVETKPEMEIDGSTTTEEVTLTKDNFSSDGRENSTGNTGKEQNANQNQQLVNNTFTNNTLTVNQTVTEFSQNINGGQLGAQEIYNQIGEYIKTHIRPGVSEVEMQLNPENLGSLHIHLSSKQGNVTAQFVVQNENVKVALEMQLIQLKENFAEQGIKVDAVEVTVESHAFSQNMQQSNEGNAETQEEAKRATIRRINLNEEWTEEELTEEEQLVAEMMEANGNTVDYMA